MVRDWTKEYRSHMERYQRNLAKRRLIRLKQAHEKLTQSLIKKYATLFNALEQEEEKLLKDLSEQYDLDIRDIKKNIDADNTLSKLVFEKFKNLQNALYELDRELNSQGKFAEKRYPVDKNFLSNEYYSMLLMELTKKVKLLTHRASEGYWPLLGKSTYANLETQRLQAEDRFVQLLKTKNEQEKRILDIKQKYHELSEKMFREYQQKFINYCNDRIFASNKTMLNDLMQLNNNKIKKVQGTIFDLIPKGNVLTTPKEYTDDLIIQFGEKVIIEEVEIPGKKIKKITFNTTSFDGEYYKNLLEDRLDIREFEVQSRRTGHDSFIEPYFIDLSNIDVLEVEDPEVVKNLILRILNILPAGCVKINVYDPVGRGDNIKYLFRLNDEMDKLFIDGKVKFTNNELKEMLEFENRHIAKINSKYLAGKYKSLVERNRDVQMGKEPYHLVVFFASPNQFDKYNDYLLEEYRSLVKNAGKYGVFVLACYEGAQWKNGRSIEQQRQVGSETLSRNIFSKDYEFQFTVSQSSIWRANPIIHASGEKEIIERLESGLINLDKLEVFPDKVYQVSKQYYFQQQSKGIEVAQPVSISDMDAWWKGSSVDIVSAHVGIQVANQTIPMIVHIGGNAQCNGILIGGSSGSGKSNLLHSLILEWTIKYSPDELNLYLIDMKHGSEMARYQHLPHAKVVALESNVEYALGILEYLRNESEKRNKLFIAKGVSDYSKYRKITGEVLPRIIMVIDEFSLLFERNDSATFGLTAIVNQMRAQGIHLVLAAQQLKTFVHVPEKLLQTIPQRIVLRVQNESESNAFLSPNNNAAAHIPSSKIGQAIFNCESGDISHNVYFQTTYMDDNSVEMALSNMSKLSENKPYVFENRGYSSWEIIGVKRIREGVVVIGDTMKYGILGEIEFSSNSVGHVLLSHKDILTTEHVLSNMVFSFIVNKAKIHIWGNQCDSTLLGYIAKKNERNIFIYNNFNFGEFIKNFYDEVVKRRATKECSSERNYIVIQNLESIPVKGDTLAHLKELLETGSEVGVFIIINIKSITSVNRILDIASYRIHNYFSTVVCDEILEDNSKLMRVDNAQQILIYDTTSHYVEKIKVYDSTTLSLKSIL